jgi:hypothetical protein
MDGRNLSLVDSLKLILTVARALASAIAPGFAQARAILLPIETRSGDIEIRAAS